MPIAPKALVESEKLAAEIAKIKDELKPDVVEIKHTIGNDWTGEQALYLRVLLSDEASRPDRLKEVTGRVNKLISERLDPLHSWGLIPYLKFRSQSEQAILQEQAWV